MPLKAKHRIPESEASSKGQTKGVLMGDFLISRISELASLESETTVCRGWINPPESNGHE
jgi:hypothetical protein